MRHQVYLGFRDTVSSLRERLLAPIDIAYLVYFRIVFGLIMLWEVGRYLSSGWIHRYFILPKFFFSYYGFDWVQPWPGDGMYIHFVVLGVLAIFILLGLFYRLSMSLFFLAFTQVFLADKSNYLNHFYLISLVSFLLILLPAHREVSLDCRMRPAIRSAVVPAWTLWLLRFQVGVPYFFGGIAKLNSDWLQGEPMRMWLYNRTDFPLFGQFFTEAWMVNFFVYGGLLLDLLIVPLLLIRRTRILALLLACTFHLFNARLFNIGIFPWFMIAATLIYLEPATFSRWLERFRNRNRTAIPQNMARTSKLTFYFLTIYVLLQILLPFRHWLYPGNVSWTEEGHNFSWHMKLRAKKAHALFVIIDPVNKRRWTVRPRDYLTRRQARKMSRRPHMILQYAHWLARKWEANGYPGVEVRARVRVSLNGRRRQTLIDPKIDLAKQQRNLLPATWIVPLTEPLVVQRR